MDARTLLPRAGQACATCSYWRPDRVGDRDAAWGQCRRMPPAMPPVQDDKIVHVGVWPHTQETDWCGEWKAADEPPQR